MIQMDYLAEVRFNNIWVSYCYYFDSNTNNTIDDTLLFMNFLPPPHLHPPPNSTEKIAISSTCIF